MAGSPDFRDNLLQNRDTIGSKVDKKNNNNNARERGGGVSLPYKIYASGRGGYRSRVMGGGVARERWGCVSVAEIFGWRY